MLLLVGIQSGLGIVASRTKHEFLNKPVQQILLREDKEKRRVMLEWAEWVRVAERVKGRGEWVMRNGRRWSRRGKRSRRKSIAKGQNQKGQN